MPILEPAQLCWRDGQPYAADFQDIYHSADGAGEVRRVFLEPAGFDALLADAPRRLLVGELGFGTGLNFAVVAEACLAAGVPLHFVSVDRAPISVREFREICRQRSSSLPVYRELSRVYPPLLGGWHRRILAGGRVTLSVCWGDAVEALEQIRAEQRQPFGLWLLDGFAPDRNPDMWQPRLFEHLAAISGPGARVATFTSAGRVRRGLAEVGFRMRRVDQRPHKRESLAGELIRGGMPPFPRPSRVDVVGAGLAGASVARHLALVGIPVRVFDAVGTAAGASAIPATVLHGRLLAGDGPAAALRAHAYLYAASFSSAFEQSEGGGALQVPSPSYPVRRLESVASTFAPSGDWLRLLDAAESAELCGLPLDVPTLHFPHARIVDTPALCSSLLDHPLIETVPRRVGSWPDAPAVLACADSVRDFEGAGFLELATVQGQVDVFEPATAALRGLRAAIVGNGYLASMGDGIIAGATYEYRPWDQARADAANAAHLERLAGPAAAGCRWRARHRGTRCVSSDRLPVAGVLDESDHAPARYVSTGHGSMGTVTSHFCAALIAASICGEFLPAEPALAALVAPQRFRARQARRGYRFGATESGPPLTS